MDPASSISKRAVRIALVVLGGVAFVTLALWLSLPPQPQPVELPVGPPPPHQAELARCRDLKRAEDVDDACRAAWAEVRRVFFMQGTR